MNAPEIFSDYFVSVPDRFAPLFEGAATLWDPLNRLEEFVKASVKPSLKGVKIIGAAHIEDNVEIGEGTVVEHGAVIKGPTIIGNNCQVRAGAYIRGSVLIGDRCRIGHAGEVNRSILFTGVKLGHFNYVGDSILGSGAHFGGGAITANTRFDENPIMVTGVATNRKKLGIIAGDRCQVGVNVSVGPGVILKPNTWIVSKDQLKAGVYGKEDLKER